MKKLILLILIICFSAILVSGNELENAVNTLKSDLNSDVKLELEVEMKGNLTHVNQNTEGELTPEQEELWESVVKLARNNVDKNHSIEIEVEYDEDIEIMNDKQGAKIRMLQLERTLHKKISTGKAILNVTNNDIPDEAKGALEELKKLEENVSNCENKTAQKFIAFKKKGQELIKTFRQSTKDAVKGKDKREAKELAKEMQEERVNEFTDEINESIKEYNTKTFVKVIEELEDIPENVKPDENDALSDSEIKEALHNDSEKLNKTQKEKIIEKTSQEKEKRKDNAKETAKGEINNKGKSKRETMDEEDEKDNPDEEELKEILEENDVPQEAIDNITEAMDEEDEEDNPDEEELKEILEENDVPQEAIDNITETMDEEDDENKEVNNTLEQYYCPKLPESLRECKEFECEFEDMVSGEMMKKKVYETSEGCVYEEELSTQQLLKCVYDLQTRKKAAEYYEELHESYEKGMTIQNDTTSFTAQLEEDVCEIGGGY